MAGARVQRIGSVFSRVQSLIRCGALSESERPVWYDVYQAFPPYSDPIYHQPSPVQEPIDMFYKEDLIRAKFYKIYGCPDIIDMKDHKNPSLSQRFVKKYIELESKSTKPDVDLFKETVDAITSEGFILKTLEDIKKSKERKKEVKVKEQAPSVSSEQVFGNVPTTALAEEEDFVEDENYDKR